MVMEMLSASLWRLDSSFAALKSVSCLISNFK